MEIWEKEWDMEFNPSKCQVLHITKNKKTNNNKQLHSQFLHVQILEHVPNAKYSGLDISSDPSFNTHISRIATNANKTWLSQKKYNNKKRKR